MAHRSWWLTGTSGAAEAVPDEDRFPPLIQCAGEASGEAALGVAAAVDHRAEPAFREAGLAPKCVDISHGFLEDPYLVDSAVRVAETK